MKTGNWFIISKDLYNEMIFKDCLNKLGYKNILHVSLSALFDMLKKQKPSIINFLLIDLNHFNKGELSEYLEFITVHKMNIKEIVVNFDRDSTEISYLKLPFLSGFFYTDEAVDLIFKGLHEIENGNIWIPRKISDKIILSLSQQYIPTATVEPLLTSREVQIFKYITQGATDNEIAEKLFVSENTIKTHVHRVFKKINVKNRIQAVLWARGMYE